MICKTVRKELLDFEISSLLGSCLGSTFTDRKVKIIVSNSRTTCPFATRFILANEKMDDGSERSKF